MGGFDFQRIKKFINKNYNICVETGTFKGKGTNNILKIPYLNKVYTIEINDILFEKANKLFENNTKVKCLHGDSGRVIKQISQELNDYNCNIIFWLDAHWSGDENIDWENSRWHGYGVNTGYRGEKSNNILSQQQVPLEEEILDIYENIKNECLIYIDDYDKIDSKTRKGLKNVWFKGEDWSHLNFNKIFKKIKDRTILIKEIRTKNTGQCIIKLKKKD